MTDRELLELAAKAAGIVPLPSDDPGPLGFWIGDGDRHVCWWNPLDNDGDALRLAVRLRLSVANNGDTVQVCSSPSGCRYERISGDEYAATRRAIVRAAAAIGEAR